MYSKHETPQFKWATAHLPRRYKLSPKRLQRVMENILRDPLGAHGSHELERRPKADLRGKRGYSFVGGFRIIATPCDWCIDNGYQRINNCSFCPGHRRRVVVFFAFGRHEQVYADQYRA